MILITGGTGYIGSHTAVELLDAGYEILILDNLCNSKCSVVDRISQICAKKPVFIEADIRDRPAMTQLFRQYQFSAVMHFAGLKAVGESITQPLS